MTLNPTIRSSYVWLVLAFLADLSFTVGLIWPENGGIIATLAAIPVLFLAFPLSAAAAFEELPRETQAQPWVRNFKDRPRVLFVGMLAALVFGLVPFLVSKGQAPVFGWIAFLGLTSLEFLTIRQTFQLYSRHRERCVLRALLTQFLAVFPTALLTGVFLLEMIWEILVKD